MPTTQETIQKLRDFANLPNGWHFGDGVAPSQERIDQAILFINHGRSRGLSRTNAFPGVNGQIEVTFYDDDRMLEITIEADDSLTIAEDENNAQVNFNEGISTSHAYERLNAWASLDLSIESITILSVQDQDFLPKLSTFEAVNQSRWLTTIVQLPRANQFALTFSDFTTSRLAIHPYIGPFPTTYFYKTFESNWDEVQLATNAIGTFSGERTLLVEPFAA